MARFELGDEYVEVWREGDALLTRRGRAGAAPPGPVVRFVGSRDRHRYLAPEDDLYAAQDDEDAARDRYVAFQSECLRSGWRRVRDPDREADVGGEPYDPDLDRALRADPEDEALASVYADWLEQRGHPRGTLIALQARRELAAEAARLLEREAPRLLGPLAGHLGLEVRWHRGFLWRADVLGNFRTGDAAQLLWELLRHPSARFLRELTVQPGWHYWNRGGAFRLLVDLLLLHPGRPPLRHLTLGAGTDAQLGDLRGLDEAYPDLEELVLQGGNQLELGAPRLPRLRQLAVRTVNLKLATLTSVIDGALPALAELELWLGAQSECTLGDLELLLDGTVELPRLRILRLRGAQFADALCERLVRSWHAPTLEVLDLDRSALTDRGVATLVAARETFARLRQVSVERCALSDPARASLRAFG